MTKRTKGCQHFLIHTKISESDMTLISSSPLKYRLQYHWCKLEGVFQMLFLVLFEIKICFIHICF